MAFIEEELFHDKRANLIVYEKLTSILLHGVLIAFIEEALIHDK
jgi:hypothetical protein